MNTTSSRMFANRRTRAMALTLAVLWAPSARVMTQSVNVTTSNGVVQVRAQGLGLIQADSLTRLKDGRSVRIDLDLGVLPAAGAPPHTRARRTFVVSYDLWEERFAVTLAEPSRSISHLTAAAAEAWCLAQVAVPVSALGRLGVDVPFWIRLEYRVLNGDTRAAPETDEGFTLQGLIDALSRKGPANEATRTIEAGPFRVKP